MQLQEAYWFYEDFYSDKFRHLPKLKMRSFCQQYFQSQQLLHPHANKFEQLFVQWRDYMGQVPVCGCILLSPSMEEVLLVRSWQGSSWGFPKGKVDKDEEDVDCAAREVYEEVGFDVSGRIDKEAFVQVFLNGKKVRLYIIRNVDKAVQFQTRTRKEIGAIEWFPIAQISNKDKKFWNVAPVVDRLRAWVRRETKRSQRSASRSPPLQPKPAPVSPSRQAPLASRAPPTPTRGRADRSRAPRSSTNNRASRLDELNDVTFAGESKVGWSPEQMFEANERLFGVKSTVPVNDIVYPPNMDELIAKFLPNHKNNKHRPNKFQSQSSRPPQPQPSQPRHRSTPNQPLHSTPVTGIHQQSTASPAPATTLACDPELAHLTQMLRQAVSTMSSSSVLSSTSMSTSTAPTHLSPLVSPSSDFTFSFDHSSILDSLSRTLVEPTR